MKRIISLLLVLLSIIAMSYTVRSQELVPYVHPFTGRWQASDDALLIDDYGLQDIQNLRKDGKHFKGVSGHTAINTIYVSGATNTYPWVLNGFHFKKDQPSESHVIVFTGEWFQYGAVHLADGSCIADGSCRAGSFLTTLLQDTTVIPGVGDFTATHLYTPTDFDEVMRFSNAPSGNMVIANGTDTLIWGGDEIEATSFITSASTVLYTLTSSNDYSDILSNNSQITGQTATLSAATSGTFLIGSKRQLQGVKLYVKTANDTASTLTGKEWTGAAWTALTLTDNTAYGGKTLYQTGTVTWTYSGNAVPRYINGLSLYWYQFTFSAGSSTLYYVTVDAPVQTMKNIWDGVEEYTVKCLKYDGTTYKDYTNQVNDGSQSTYADFSSLATTHAIYLGFLNPQQGINFTFVAGSENGTGTTQMSLYYWTGAAWAAAGASNDGTATTTTSFSKGGVVSFQGATKGTEAKRAISDEYPLYYYKIQFANNLDADVKVSEITGIAYPDPVSAYTFSETFQNRLFLFNEKAGDKNKAIYSTYNAPDLMNGDDYGEITFGDRQALTAAAVIYNIYTNTAVEQMLVTKRNETYRLSGTDPSNWVLQKMSTNIGCVAPLSMVSAEMTESADVKRTVAIWLSDKAVVMSDGATIVPISDDIKCYFDPNDSRYISSAMKTRSVAWYDPSTRSYKLLIASGASATYLNTELEYSLKYKEWTKIYRENAAGANPLQSGFQVWDTNGVGYTYGGGKDGFVYRLENGNNWNSVANITSYLHTKDMILDNVAPMMRQATIKYLRTMYKKKAVGNVTINHYGDKTITTSGVSGQMGPAIITTASTTQYNTQSSILGPWLMHSLKYSATTNVADGLELLGIGLYFAPSTVIR